MREAESVPNCFDLVIDSVTRTHRRGSETVTAVDDVSLHIRCGQMSGIVGPSGSGKTTLLNLVIGEDDPDRGSITGRPADLDWRAMSIVPQQLGLLSELTVRENIEFPTRFHRSEVDPDALMSLLGVEELASRFPDQTSLGQQQRVAIARALVTTPSMVVADEPTSHQDEANVEVVVSALRSAAEGGAMVIVATHDRRVVERCDVVFGLDGGRLVESTDLADGL